ncbi:hypothetical protein N8342_11675 [Acidimicrobiales bacterium]|nr:hypothetical protein [Acidimicrobiales bacterium]
MDLKALRHQFTGVPTVDTPNLRFVGDAGFSKHLKTQTAPDKATHIDREKNWVNKIARTAQASENNSDLLHRFEYHIEPTLLKRDCVGVEGNDRVSTSDERCDIERDRVTGVRWQKDASDSEFTAQPLSTSVCRPIVDDHHFHVGFGKNLHSLQHVARDLPRVPIDNHNRDARPKPSNSEQRNDPQ